MTGGTETLPCTMDEFLIHSRDRLTNVCQLLSGWHQDGTAWSQWDQEVYDAAIKLLRECYWLIENKPNHVRTPSGNELVEALERAKVKGIGGTQLTAHGYNAGLADAIAIVKQHTPAPVAMKIGVAHPHTTFTPGAHGYEGENAGDGQPDQHTIESKIEGILDFELGGSPFGGRSRIIANKVYNSLRLHLSPEREYGAQKHKPEKRAEFLVLPDKCPTCGDRMIENSKYIECGSLNCRYIKVTK